MYKIIISVFFSLLFNLMYSQLGGVYTGNVGIKTDAPTKALDINGEVRMRSLPGGQNTDYVVLADADGNLRKLSIEQVNNNGGKANSGNGAPNAINNPSPVPGDIWIDNVTGDTWIFVNGSWKVIKNIYNSDGVVTSNRIINQNGNIIGFTGIGNFGIGTSAPTSKLHVEGTARVTNMPTESAPTFVVVTTATGDLKKITLSEFKQLLGNITPSQPTVLNCGAWSTTGYGSWSSCINGTRSRDVYQTRTCNMSDQTTSTQTQTVQQSESCSTTPTLVSCGDWVTVPPAGQWSPWNGGCNRTRTITQKRTCYYSNNTSQTETRTQVEVDDTGCEIVSCKTVNNGPKRCGPCIDNPKGFNAYPGPRVFICQQDYTQTCLKKNGESVITTGTYEIIEKCDAEAPDPPGNK